MKINIEYDGNDNETYSLMLNQIPYAELLLDEDGAKNITDDIRSFIALETDEESMIGIQNDDEKLGVIVDITDKDQDNIIAEATYWFEDYRE